MKIVKIFSHPCPSILAIVTMIWTIMTIFVIYIVINHTCTIQSFDKEICYIELGLYYMNQFYTTKNNQTTIMVCGPLLNCNQTCPTINIGGKYVCQYFQNELYHLYFNDYFGLGIIIFCSVINVCLIILLCIFSIFIYKEQNEEYHYLAPLKNIILCNF